ncbi:hypothetical protein DEU56DRAFT_353756 [Suillus clintonianus]|uniref:uncharacterized protein n=1 Tax=Suillus clintonianus TaxID=1904413 RepID=UPI001B879CBC|nr:uncharacterized protein DEU56DRAFT_353756 [Suillus clintonianus]KAG2137029.1 hypothetical protein DEU56DRAFT_353756 [Suillus clintonianus]
MEYSAADIAEATSLQYLAYLYTSLATFWTYDYACSLHEEWKFLLRSRWTKVKGLYIITRHVPFFLISMDIYLTFAPSGNPNKCRTLGNIYVCFGVISLTCSECFFVLRTYALWDKNRIVLAAMVSTYVAGIVASIGIRFATIPTSYVTTSAIPGITGCYRTSRSAEVFLPFLLMCVFQLGLISLTLICVVRSWRATRSPLFVILVKHNIFYYACGLVLSAVNILLPVLVSNSAYYTVIQDFQVFILAILATSMHLHLWRIDQHVHGSDLVCISLSDMSPADPYM